jgi:hypothetical protein
MTRARLLAALLACASLGPATAQDDAAPPVLVTVTVPDLAQRLQTLDPASAEGYFLLAEEVASEDSSEAGLALARRLFVIAHSISQEQATSGGADLADSACLALAQLARSEPERRWLLALISSQPGPAAIAPELQPPQGPAISDESPRFKAATAIGLARAGDLRAAFDRWRLEAVQRAVADLDPPAPLVRQMLDADPAQSVCPSCRNRRVVKSDVPSADPGSASGPPVDTLCPVCRGNPGPALNETAFAQSISAEAKLVGARIERWSAQLWLDGGLPFRDPDPSELASRFNVSPFARTWVPDPQRPQDPHAGAWR